MAMTMNPRALTVPSSQRDLDVVEILPGFAITSDMTFEERLELNDMIESYVSQDAINFADFRVFDLVVDVLGVVCKPLDAKIDPKSGEMRRHNMLTLVKFFHQEKGEGVLSFVSVTATDWAMRMMALFGRPGDFPQSVTYLIKQLPADVGHTYSFQRVKPVKGK